MTEQSPQRRKINWVNWWTIAGGMAAVVATIVALVTLFNPPATSTEAANSSSGASEPVGDANAPSQDATSTQPVPTTATTIPKQWVEIYKGEIIKLRDAVSMDFDGPHPMVKTDEFLGADLRTNDLAGNTWSEEPAVLSIHDGPGGSPESCAKSLDTSPVSNLFLDDGYPFLCVRTDAGSIAFIAVQAIPSTYGPDHDLTVTLWQLA